MKTFCPKDMKTQEQVIPRRKGLGTWRHGYTISLALTNFAELQFAESTNLNFELLASL
jgi:hypothetical protein